MENIAVISLQSLLYVYFSKLKTQNTSVLLAIKYFDCRLIIQSGLTILLCCLKNSCLKNSLLLSSCK